MANYERLRIDGISSGVQPIVKTQHCPNCEATEQKLHDFRQQVSDAVEDYTDHLGVGELHFASKKLGQFIIAKPDPLVEVLLEMELSSDLEEGQHDAKWIRSKLDALGFEIREKNDG